MAKAKWFPSLSATTALDAAARVVLRLRAGTVRRYLDRVASRAIPVAEDVHQLRVSTRRLVAALAVFKSVLRPRLRKRLRRAARRLRRVSGAVRDLDVLRSLLEERLSAASRTSDTRRSQLSAMIEKKRRAARRELAEAIAKWRTRFVAAARAARASLRAGRPAARDGEDDPPLGAVAHAVLTRRLRQLVTAGRADLRNLDRLHQLRIAAKRLRYAMEVFAGCYRPAFRGVLYEQVQRLQDDLGAINDLRNLDRLLVSASGWPPSDAARSRSGNDELVRLLRARVRQELRQRQRDFLARWTARRRAGFQRRFERIVGGHELAERVGTFG